MPICGYPTKSGQPCRFPRGQCKVESHGSGPAQTPEAPPSERERVPDAIVDHNLHALGWWLAEEVVCETIERDKASILVSIMRMLASLGDEPPSGDDVREEALLRAQLAFGMPPQDEAGWAMAERLLDPETLREARRQVEAATRRREAMELEVRDRLNGA